MSKDTLNRLEEIMRKIIVAFVAFVAFGNVNVQAHAKKNATKQLAIWMHNYNGNCWHFQRAVAEIVQANLKRKLAYYGFKHGIKTSKKRMYRFEQRRIMMYRARIHHDYFIDVKCEQSGKKYIGYTFAIRQTKLHKASSYGSGYGIGQPAKHLISAIQDQLQTLKLRHLRKSPAYNYANIQKILNKMKPQLEQKKLVHIPKSNLQFALGFGFNLFGSVRSTHLNSYLGCAVGLFRVRYLRIGLHYSACIGKSPAGDQFGLDMLHNPEFTVTALKFGTATRFNLVFGAGFLYHQAGMIQGGFLSSHTGPSFSLTAELMPKETLLRLNFRLSWTPGHLQTLNQPDYWDWGRVNLQFSVLFGN